MEPVPAARQRETLEFLKKNVFAADAFDMPADLLNRLAATRWRDFEFSVFQMPRLEYPIHDVAWNLQGFVLDQLYSPEKLDSLVDLERHFADGEKPFTVLEMFDGIQSTVWSEIQGTGSPRINSFRRGLQRRHLDELIALVTAPEDGTPEDACTMARGSLKKLQGQIQGSMRTPEVDTMTRAHLDESLARIEAALEAQIRRSL